MKVTFQTDALEGIGEGILKVIEKVSDVIIIKFFKKDVPICVLFQKIKSFYHSFITSCLKKKNFVPSNTGTIAPNRFKAVYILIWAFLFIKLSGLFFFKESFRYLHISIFYSAIGAESN